MNVINGENNRSWSCQSDESNISIAQSDNYKKLLTWQASMVEIVNDLNREDDKQDLAGLRRKTILCIEEDVRGHGANKMEETGCITSDDNEKLKH